MASLKPKKLVNKDEEMDLHADEVCDVAEISKLYSKKCSNNKSQLQAELANREQLAENPDENAFLYPILDDPNFNIKIAEKKEFSDTKYDGSIHDVEEYANILKKTM
jgi:hypothetical protein